jgi:hypothetical protein
MATLTGHCLCGAVRYQVSEPFEDAGYCHCTRCQRRSGTAAAASARVAPGSFRIVSGDSLLRAWQPEDGFAKVFCCQCGGALYSQDPNDPQVISVRMGTIDGDPGIRPRWRQHVGSAAPWEPIPDDGLPRYEGSRL